MKTLPHPTVSSAAVLDLYDGLRELNYVSELDCPELGFSRSDLFDVELRIPADTAEKLWQIAYKRGAPAHVGLVIGGRVNENSKGIISNLAISSGNLYEAIQLFEKYIPIMSETEFITLVPVSNGLKVIYHFHDERYYHQASLARSMSAGVAWATYLTGKIIRPLEAGFRYQTVEAPERWKQVFGENCRFGVKADYLIVSNEDLGHPVVSSNELLKKVLIEKVDGLVNTLNKEGQVSRAVKRIINDNLHLGVVTSGFVAKELNISRQTLHRRLSSEGFNFRHLLSEVRKEKVQYHLAEGDCELEMLSEILGFSDPSAFFKAFKNWFDSTPRRFQSD